MSAISNLSSNILQSVLSTALQGTGLTTKTPPNSATGMRAPLDNSQLSPFIQMMSTLDQLHQSDPAKYKQVTQQIATNLQSAAQTAQAEGNSAAASELNQIASHFTNASMTGQFPTIQELAQAITGHHHHHHAHSAPADPNGDPTSSSSSSASSSSVSQPQSQLLSAFQANGPQSDSLNPMSIIMNTLSDAGVSSPSV